MSRKLIDVSSQAELPKTTTSASSEAAPRNWTPQRRPTSGFQHEVEGRVEVVVADDDTDVRPRGQILAPVGAAHNPGHACARARRELRREVADATRRAGHHHLLPQKRAAHTECTQRGGQAGDGQRRGGLEADVVRQCRHPRGSCSGLVCPARLVEQGDRRAYLPVVRCRPPRRAQRCRRCPGLAASPRLIRPSAAARHG